MKEEVTSAMLEPVSRFPWWLVGLKIALLLSFCGGPLALADYLKSNMGSNSAFAIGIAPMLPLVFGVYSVRSPSPDLWDKCMVLFGCTGVVALFGMNIFGVWQLSVNPERADATLLVVGVAVGTAFSVYYAYETFNFFRARRHAV